MQDKKGFTLIEVLIVVIIIAILAGLILPRFFSQPERGYIAEAQQMLGVIRRGQANMMDSTGTSSYRPITACPVAAPCVADEWAAVGITAPDTNPSGAFDYSCVAGSLLCTATRRNQGAARDTNFITLTNAGIFSCTGTASGLVPYTNAPAGSQGCRA